MVRLIYERKLNSDNKYYNRYIQWIPFSEFGNIEYLAKGGFGEVHKATWIRYDWNVVLKRLYNSSNNILDILKEVNKKKFNINVNIDLSIPLNEIPCKREFKG